jgi:sugar phosphate isomerase/epimerase
MFFSGIADEAAPQLTRQLEAHKDLRWRHIEIRNIEGSNLTDLSDEAFEKVAAEIESSGIGVSCFASQLANWARPIDSDFEVDIGELKRAIPRMKRLKTPFIRCMSYPNSDPPLSDSSWRREAVRRLQALAKLAKEAGITLVHENCNGWGGQGPQQTLDLLSDVGSEHLKLVFDTGNPVPYGQDSWDYYAGVRDQVIYVHIKDYKLNPDGGEVGVFPGEGKGAVRKILADLLQRGYDGGISIEPHITSVIHLGQEAEDPELSYRTYVEYGQKLELLVESLRSHQPGEAPAPQ